MSATLRIGAVVTCVSVSVVSITRGLAVTVWRALAARQLVQCDRNLNPPVPIEFGYRDRIDRCEGKFESRPAARTRFDVVGLVASFEPYAARSDSTEALMVEWDARPQRQATLQAQSTSPSLLYQMDTRLLNGDTTFRWRCEVLCGAHIPRESIALAGWTTERVGRLARQVYLPLRVHPVLPPGRVAPKGSGNSAEPLLVLLFSGEAADSVSFTELQLVDRDPVTAVGVPPTATRRAPSAGRTTPQSSGGRGKAIATLPTSLPTRYPIAPGSRVEVRLPQFVDPGIYALTVTAYYPAVGGAFDQQVRHVWFYVRPK